MVGVLEVAVTALQTVMSPNLFLKRAKFSRPSGQWQDEDYDVLADGKAVGRIYEDADLSTPPDLRWFWSVTEIVPAVPNGTYGHAATLDEAKAKFRAAWEKAKARD
jgi:hypothetical protein